LRLDLDDRVTRGAGVFLDELSHILLLCVYALDLDLVQLLTVYERHIFPPKVPQVQYIHLLLCFLPPLPPLRLLNILPLIHPIVPLYTLDLDQYDMEHRYELLYALLA
jgi:hypothetical protein